MTYEDRILRIVAAHQPIKMTKIAARLTLEVDAVSTYDVQRCVAGLVERGELVEDDQFCYRTKRAAQPTATVTVRVGGVEGSVSRPLLAELPSDDEENVARLADQLVRAAVRRYHRGGAKT